MVLSVEKIVVWSADNTAWQAISPPHMSTPKEGGAGDSQGDSLGDSLGISRGLAPFSGDSLQTDEYFARVSGGLARDHAVLL